MKKSTRRSPSYINLTNVNNNSSTSSPRTPRSISKSRRPSIVQRSPGIDSLLLLSDGAHSYFPNEQEEPVYRYSVRRSSSVTSLLSSNLIPSFDGHTLYKLRTARSSKKIERFFGEDAPHDICIAEIKREGLKAILQSKYPLCYFLYHLLEEYSNENLFFFIELEQYESFKYTSIEQQIATAQHIYNTYIAKNSYFEVNLDDKVCREVTHALEQKNAKCFDVAKRAVYALLESSYMRFRISDSFNLMEKECGELITEYKRETKTAAINRLLDYINQQHNKVSHSPKSSASVRRYELMKSMIHEFCNTYIGVNITESTLLSPSQK